MFVTSYSVTYCIYVPGKPGICFHYYCAVYDECKYTLWLADRTRLFVQYTISLSSLCKLIWRHWTDKMPVRYILSGVWVRLSILSQLYIIQYVGGMCFQFTHFPCDDWENIYTLCHYHHQIGSVNFWVRSWNNGVRCMSFYIPLPHMIYHTINPFFTEVYGFIECCMDHYKEWECHLNTLERFVYFP